MDNNQHQFLYYSMWRQKALAFLVVLLVLWWRIHNDKSRARRVKYAPLMQRDIWRSSELIRLIDTSERICMRELRMSQHVFYNLCSRLRERGLLQDTFHVSVEEQVAMFLRIVGQYHTQSSVSFALWRSGWTVSRYFNVVLRALVKLVPELIYVRSTSTHPKITNSPNRFYPYFEGCIGALDGTHIRACAPPKYVYLMQELFGESGRANGSLAVDQYTLEEEDDRSESGSDDSLTAEHGENDSDTIARRSPPVEALLLIVVGHLEALFLV